MPQTSASLVPIPLQLRTVVSIPNHVCQTELWRKPSLRYQKFCQSLQYLCPVHYAAQSPATIARRPRADFLLFTSSDCKPPRARTRRTKANNDGQTLWRHPLRVASFFDLNSLLIVSPIPRLRERNLWGLFLGALRRRRLPRSTLRVSYLGSLNRLVLSSKARCRSQPIFLLTSAWNSCADCHKM
jgi:hypothetical protein